MAARLPWLVHHHHRHRRRRRHRQLWCPRHHLRHDLAVQTCRSSHFLRHPQVMLVYRHHPQVMLVCRHHPQVMQMCRHHPQHIHLRARPASVLTTMRVTAGLAAAATKAAVRMVHASHHRHHLKTSVPTTRAWVHMAGMWAW